MTLPPEPRALRLYVLVTTGVVVIGSAAAFMLWWTLYPPQPSLPAEAEDLRLDRMALHPVDFPPGTTAEERERVETCVGEEVLHPTEGRKPGECDAKMIALGRVAAARILDALDRLDQRDGFRSEESRRGGLAADRLLRQISLSIPSVPAPGVARPPDPSPAWFLRRAKAWFVWWDGVRAQGAEPR